MTRSTLILCKYTSTYACISIPTYILLYINNKLKKPLNSNCYYIYGIVINILRML